MTHQYFLTPGKPATGPGMIKLQASNSNGVHIGQIQFAGQTVVSNIWMDEDKDPKYQYCPCDRYDRQCTDSQVVPCIIRGLTRRDSMILTLCLH